MREDPARGVYVYGLTEVPVDGPQQVLDVVHASATHRATVATAMNRCSSRSHAMLLVSPKPKPNPKPNPNPNPNPHPNQVRCWQQQKGSSRDTSDTAAGAKKLVAALLEAFAVTDKDLLQLARRKKYHDGTTALLLLFGGEHP